ncbi:MAG: hypothetical protein H7Y27_16085 [Gemmatimonadaceae bacterium]|nr:hypothetical protein [Chitinophagaceae bacterium]
MLKNKIGLLVAAAAAYGVYKYFTMSEEERESLKAKGKDFFDKNVGDLSGLFGKKPEPAHQSMNNF